MATNWIVMKHFTAAQDEPGKDRRRYEPRFYFEGDNAEATAVAVSQRLNKAQTVYYSLMTLPQERQGHDHAAQLAYALTVLQGMDPDATPDSRYRVEPTFSYTGPMDDVTPVVVAMMTAFQALPNPPNTPGEAMFRIIRDAGG